MQKFHHFLLFYVKLGVFFIFRLSIVKGTFRRKDAPYQMKKPLYIIRCKMSPSPLLSSPWQATAFPMDNDCFLHAERRMAPR